VQELRKNKRRPTRTGKTNMFSGVVCCADCGEKLYSCTSKNLEARQDRFLRSASRLEGKEVCPTHFICAAERRPHKIARLFKRIYEDNANGELSDSRIQMLSNGCEQEQEDLSKNIDRFVCKVRKYLDLDEFRLPYSMTS
jgi:site-specific DNA recombinase